MLNRMVEHHSGSLDLTFGALAHPIRRDMLELLSEQPARVTALAEPFDVSLAAASKHIHVLEAAGLIERAVQGREHLLSLRPRPLIQARDWIDTYRSFWEERLDALESHLRRRR
jgi:DNA-binding transcriptional ArsR family regulator